MSKLFKSLSVIHKSRQEENSMNNAKRKSRIVSGIILASMLVQSLAGVSAYAEEATEQTAVVDDTSYTLNSLDDMKDLMVSLTYAEYIEDYALVPDASEEIVVDVTQYDKELSEGEITVNENDTVVRDGKGNHLRNGYDNGRRKAGL